MTQRHDAKIAAEADRITNLFQDLNDHLEKVASDYAKSRDKHGDAIEDALVERGLGRTFLRSLEAVGTGKADPRLFWLPQERFDLLVSIPISTQRLLLRDGLGGVKIDVVNIDDLRQFVHGKYPEIRPQHSRVRDHERARPNRHPPRLVACADGMRLRNRTITWEELLGAMRISAPSGFIPEKVLEELRAICEKELV